MKTVTKEAPLLGNVKEKEVKKDERLMIHRSDEIIDGQRKIILDRLPWLNSLQKAYLTMDIGKPTLEDLKLLISISDGRNPNAKDDVKKFLAKKAGLIEEYISLGNRKVKLSKAIESGLYELEGFDSIYSIASSAREVFTKTHPTILFTYRLVEYKNDQYILNENEMQKFTEENTKYVSTEREKEIYTLYKTITDSYNTLVEKGHIRDERQIPESNFIIKHNGKYKPHYNNIFQ